MYVPGAHAPSKPEVFVLGRKELQVSWKSPEVPLGRISRYDLSVNGEVVYSGTDLYYSVRRLKPDTEYIFMVRQKRFVEINRCKNNKKQGAHTCECVVYFMILNVFMILVKSENDYRNVECICK